MTAEPLHIPVLADVWDEGWRSAQRPFTTRSTDNPYRDIDPDLPTPTAEYIRGLCVEIQRLKAQLAERDTRFRIFIADLDAAGMKTVALGINDILEGK